MSSRVAGCVRAYLCPCQARGNAVSQICQTKENIMKRIVLLNPSIIIAMMIALFTFPAGTVLAATSCTHYVSTTGNDSNPGTLAPPWRTVQKAANTASPLNVVCLSRAGYNQRVTCNGPV